MGSEGTPQFWEGGLHNCETSEKDNIWNRHCRFRPDREPRSPLSAMTPNRSPRQCLYVEYTRQALGSAMPIGELMWHMDRDELCFLSGGGGWSH